jgi:hypothetical protein
MPISIHSDLQRRMTRERLHCLWRHAGFDPGRNCKVAKPVPIEPLNFGIVRQLTRASDGLSVARVLLTPEAMLDGRRIKEFFSQRFFSTEFWLLWSTIMGSLPEHSAIDFRRYMNRFLYLFEDVRLVVVRLVPIDART